MELADLNAKMQDPSVWEDRRRAQSIGRRISHIENKLNTFNDLKTQVEDSISIAVLAEEEGDISLLEDLKQTAQELSEKIHDLEFETLFSGPYDSRDAIVTLHAGAGGTEAMDWVEMLYRMYSRWVERKGFELETLDMLPGEEAGLKSVSFSVRGDHAYGFCAPKRACTGW